MGQAGGSLGGRTTRSSGSFQQKREWQGGSIRRVMELTFPCPRKAGTLGSRITANRRRDKLDSSTGARRGRDGGPRPRGGRGPSKGCALTPQRG